MESKDEHVSSIPDILLKLRDECLMFQKEYDPVGDVVSQVTEFLENHIFPARDTLDSNWLEKLAIDFKGLRFMKYVAGPANRVSGLDWTLETRIPALSLLNFLTFRCDSTIINFRLYLKQSIRTDSMVMKILPSILDRCVNLTEVYLTSECNNRIVKQIANANCETLRVLSIRKTIYISNRCLPEVLRCVNLQSLDLGDTLVCLDGHQLRALSNLRHLYGGRYDLASKYDTFDGHTLAIEEATLVAPCIQAAQATSRICPVLQRLNLVNVNCTDDDIDWLRIETLTSVTIEHTNLHLNNFLKRFFTVQNDTITTVVLNQNKPLNRRFLAEMGNVLPNLEYLKFINCQVELSDYRIEENQTYFEKLHYLISDSYLPFCLVVLLLLHSLEIRVIDLKGHRMEAHTLNYLMQRRDFPNLETFNVYIDHMAPALCRRLKSLSPNLKKNM